jgi:FimV-like protein
MMCVLVSQSVFGLEFGDPEVQSTTNAPLELHIPLRDLGQISPTELFPLLASEAEFSERNLDRPESLSSLTYSVASEGGETRLVIRSARAWPESELTTLVELFTPDGPQVIPVSVQFPPSSTAPRSAGQVVLEVPDGATLWRLASRIQPDDLTIEQVMMALYDTNPDAFEFENVNALERGAQLRVPPQPVMEIESPAAAKARFDAHMSAPTANFPRLASRLNQLEASPTTDAGVAMSSATEKTPDQVAVSPPKTQVNDAPQVNEAPQVNDSTQVNDSNQVNEAAQTETLVVEEPESRSGESSTTGQSELIADESTQIETPVTIRSTPPMAAPTADPGIDQVAQSSSDVDRLIEKLTALESKLEQVDEKLEAMTTERADPTEAPASSEPVEAPVEPTLTDQIAAIDWNAWVEQGLALIPTRAEFDAFRRTQTGQGTLIFFGVLVFALLARQVYGRQSRPLQSVSPVAAAQQPPVTPELPAPAPAPHDAVADTPPFASVDNEPRDSVEVPTDTSDALESAIERLKQKIDDPARASEAESLYASGADDEALIDAFSADALNENPEWGEDPDDEADIATHQLELARSYLDMGMKQTAIELLERVAVSPDKASAMQARTMLDASRA